MSTAAEILHNLTPTAAKLYLTLLLLADPNSRPLAATAPMPKLVQLTGLSERTCIYALRQLRNLELIERIRKTHHTPCTYLIAPPANFLASLPPNPQPSAPLPPLTRNVMHPSAPSNPQPLAPLRPKSPSPALKNPNPLSPASLLNDLLDPTCPLACDDPALLASLFSQLTESEKAAAIAQARAVLAAPSPGLGTGLPRREPLPSPQTIEAHQ